MEVITLLADGLAMVNTLRPPRPPIPSGSA